MNPKRPVFIISLDLELYWGMIDKVSLAEYGESLLGVRKAVPEILKIFKEYGLHATWATVGMLMHESKESLLASLPEKRLRPVYGNPSLSTYEHIEHFDIGATESEDQYHFGPSLVREILATPNQEIASHTFSHYYCIDGDDNDNAVLDADCKAFNQVAERFGIVPKSIVFPRNQAHRPVLDICRENGIKSYRGNERHFIYKGRRDDEQSLCIRGLRLLDHYVNLTGHHTYALHETETEPITNIPASRFLRPYSKRLRIFEPLRMKRIQKSMTRAAKYGEVFHLWWHPHNFGTNLQENLRNLRTLAEHFKTLSKQYGVQSCTMQEAEILKND